VLPTILLLPLAFASTDELHRIVFFTRAPDGRLEWQWTLENLWRLAGFDVFGWSADYLWILLRTVILASVTTVLCVALAYPMAFFIAGRTPRWRTGLLLALVVPLCTNVLIRTYAWELLLSAPLPLARLAAALGLLAPGEGLVPSQLAIYIGMVSASLPFAVLPLYASVERLDRALLEAARDLYASPLGVFRHAVLPQTMPGLAAAVILTFIPAMGMFVVPYRLGGGKVIYIGDLIQQQFLSSANFPLGAALSFALVFLTLAGLAAFKRRAGEADLL
jgi:spermidine/putrescine transport system permease protein